MRYVTWKLLLFSAFLTNFIIALIMWSYLDAHCQCTDIQRKYKLIPFGIFPETHMEIENFDNNDTDKKLSEKLVVILREFEFFDNDIIDTVKSILNVLPQVKVLIVADKNPYPPITIYKDLPNSNVHIINLQPSLDKPSSLIWPNHFIDKEHILIFPDSTRIDSVSQIIGMLRLHLQKPHNIIAVPVIGDKVKCLSLNVSLRHWTIKYKENPHGTQCNAVEGSHVLLITKSLLMQFSHPFSRPFPHSLFIQSSLRKIKVEVTRNWFFQQGRALFLDPHNKWKHDNLEISRLQTLYKEFGIKKVLKPVSKVEWYGCSKSTARCFGTVVNDMPEYLFEGRWTPPCCLENLRQTARYVFSILEKCNVRYWLEGGSLLGAVRNGDIIPWDYDVDVGIYKEDIGKCEWLKNSQQQSIIDSQGFLWEKAKEGDFIRVQFSNTNHLHVDIFPFYSRNGIMTKDTWFIHHKQDMEFPEHFLKPLSKIKFVGVHASAPNNIRNFIEMKFGKNAIEKPQYPVPDILSYSKRQL